MKKSFLLFLVMVVLANFVFAQEAKYQLSSHILDITLGKPAANVKIILSKRESADTWAIIEEKFTDENGRINDFLKVIEGINRKGVYKLTYNTAPYFKTLGQESFYPYIEVVFELKDRHHYHVPITLSPFGYSTYKGN